MKYALLPHRFLELGPDECWPWIGRLDQDGYGRYGSELGHRLVYVHRRSPIPRGLQLDHLCRVRWCVNPGHLDVVTLAENNRRGESPSGKAGRKTHCLRGHEFTSSNTYVAPGAPGERHCLTCKRASKKASGQRRVAA